MTECNYCNNEIDWRPVPGKFKADGRPLSVPVNLDGKDHICPMRKVPGDKWKPRWNVMMDLPVYCFTCYCTYLNTNPCTHLINLGFIPHTKQYDKSTWSYPPRWMERALRKIRESKALKPKEKLKVDYDNKLDEF